MSTMKKTALGVAVAATMFSTPLLAYEAGDMILRLGPAGVFPTGESDDLAVLQPLGLSGQVEADDAWSLGITFTYMFTDQIGLNVLGAWPFEHDIQPKGDLKTALGNDNDIGSTKHLPPTVTLQWHLPIGPSNFNTWIGAGVNYTYFFDEDTEGNLNGADLDIDDSWGLAGEVGFDYVFNNDWTVGAQLWYIQIEPDAEVTGPASTILGPVSLNEDLEVEIDPWVFMASVGKKF